MKGITAENTRVARYSARAKVVPKRTAKVSFPTFLSVGSSRKLLTARSAVANSPGKKIYPGQLKKALDLLAKGKAVDYEGATAVNFTDVGEAFGSFLEKEVKGGKFKTKKQR